MVVKSQGGPRGLGWPALAVASTTFTNTARSPSARAFTSHARRHRRCWYLRAAVRAEAARAPADAGPAAGHGLRVGPWTGRPHGTQAGDASRRMPQTARTLDWQTGSQAGLLLTRVSLALDRAPRSLSTTPRHTSGRSLLSSRRCCGSGRAPATPPRGARRATTCGWARPRTTPSNPSPNPFLTLTLGVLVYLVFFA